MNGRRFVMREARHINGRRIQDMQLIHDGHGSKTKFGVVYGL